jgi:hypothetical protein
MDPNPDPGGKLITVHTGSGSSSGFGTETLVQKNIQKLENIVQNIKLLSFQCIEKKCEEKGFAAGTRSDLL